MQRILKFGLMLALNLSLNIAHAQLNIPKVCQENLTSLQRNQAERKLEYYHKYDKAGFKKDLFHYVSQHNNLGGDTFNFHNGPKDVYRSSILSGAPSCLTALATEHHLKNIVYLYDGNYINEETIPYKEEKLLKKLGGISYIRMLNFSDRYSTKQQEQRLTKQVTNVVKIIAALDGTTLIHCIGGWHRTGIVYGVLEKCINKQPTKKVIANYLRHTNYYNKKHTGAAQQRNINFIKLYNCNFLRNV